MTTKMPDVGENTRHEAPVNRGVSAVIVTCNEAHKVEPCLQGVVWADEIVVVDLESTDDTVAICRRYTDKVISHPRVPYVEIVRNYAIAQASYTWILLLDGDEYVTPALALALRRVADEDWPVDMVTLERNHMRFGRILTRSEVETDARRPEPRFFRQGRVSWPERIHVQLDLHALRVKHLPGSEAGVIEHAMWLGVSDVVDRYVRYPEHEAQGMLENDRVGYATGRVLHRAWSQFA